MFSFIMQIFLVMVCQLALLVRLINGQFRLNDDRHFLNKYKPRHRDEELVELLHDVNDISLPYPSHESPEIAVLHKENLSNLPVPSVGINGLMRHGYVFYKEEDEKIYDTKFIEASKMADEIFSEWKNQSLTSDLQMHWSDDTKKTSETNISNSQNPIPIL
ncbi:uncharacterized protein LOC100575135 [Acyrthosiphon pisum]|uniref:Uncharacterized protein n=1 Tax=Acyrthosiphon pisum TaxID=7029 RepID=A0A8R1W8M0_ACYPI|nr:uncharacterized protein LOC100575135 [Acyrthosiphon pisum]|eukprot:XP_003244130.1 PREDICTED: uncharacterized protein LOC100575135 [Acyrthosiphon pisum]